VNQLDTIDRGVTDYQKAGRQIFCLHVSDLAALVAVARITIKRRRNALERARTVGPEWERLEDEDILLIEQESAALAPLLESTGPRQLVARGEKE
jgi:hypothetical protein